MNLAEKLVDFETRLKKAHISLIKHPETCLYVGAIVTGKHFVTGKQVSSHDRAVRIVTGKLRDWETGFQSR